MLGKDTALNIVHAVLSLDCGGLERLVLNLCREGVSHGDKVTVVCLDKAGELAGEVEKTGAAVKTLSRKPGLMRPSEAIRLRKLLKELSPDVIHCHQMGAALYAGSMARTLGVPAIIHTEHGNHDYRGWRRRLLASMAFAMPHRLFCVSEEIGDNLRESRVIFRSHPTVLGNGIPIPGNEQLRPDPGLRSELGIPEEVPVIGTVGRLEAVKRQERILEATAILAEKGIDLHLLMVGEGTRRSELEKLSAKLGLQKRVHFTGYQRDPLPYLNLMDVFVLTSDTEGMPMALLEAWAAKKPVVVSAVGGLPDLVMENDNGFLYPLEDRERLLHAIETLIGDPELRRRLGENGYRLVNSEYSSAEAARAYRSCYSSLLERHQELPDFNKS